MSKLPNLTGGMEETEMIHQLQAGDELAFRKLVEDYQLRVFHICMELLHVREDAEDIAQEVFVEIYHSIGRFRGASRLSTWIYRIAVNKSLNHIRRKKWHRWLQPIENLTGRREAEPVAPENTLPEREIEERQQLAQLWHALDSLPENQRKAFVLSRMEDFSYREIAAIMETTLPGVESLLQRARVNLQKKLWAVYKKELPRTKV